MFQEKRISLGYPPWHYQALTDYLTMMAQQGWFLTEWGEELLTFQAIKPKKINFCAILEDNSKYANLERLSYLSADGG